MAASLHQQLAAWRRREHYDHSRLANDQAHENGLIARIRRAERPHPVRGVDVSSYQGHVDARGLKRGGIGLIIRKASEGLHWDDPTFPAGMGDARGAGLIRGAYHFARPAPGHTGAQEADHYLTVVGQHLAHGDLYPCLDIESTQLDRAGTIAFVHDFARHIHDARGWKTIVYTYPAFLSWPPMAEPLWIAGPGDAHAPHLNGFGPASIWQNSFTGHVPGINGQVDTNITDTHALRKITIGA